MSIRKTIACLFVAVSLAYPQSKKGKKEVKPVEVEGIANDPLIQPSVADVFNTNCIKCHSGPKAAAGLDLSSYEGAMSISKKHGGSLVVNGDSGKSRLYLAILGLDKVGQMPNMRNPLEWPDILAVKRWIDSGATQKGFYERWRMVSMGGP